MFNIRTWICIGLKLAQIKLEKNHSNDAPQGNLMAYAQMSFFANIEGDLNN